MSEKTSLGDMKLWQVITYWVMLALYCSASFIYVNVLSNASFVFQFAIVIIALPMLYTEYLKLKENIKNLLWILIGMGIVFIFQTLLWDNFLYHLLRVLLGMPAINNLNQAGLVYMIKNSPIISVFMIVILGPLMEEVLYRFFCFGKLYGINHFLAHAATALLFGFQHVAAAVLWQGEFSQIINIFSYMIFSLILTNVYARKPNIWICIGIHMLNNFCGVALTLLMQI